MFFMDLAVFNIIHGLAGQVKFLDLAVIFFARYSGYILVALAFLFGFLVKSQKERLAYYLFLALSTIVSRGVITETIRFFYNRERPFSALDFEPLINHETTASFPSGHMTFYFALALGVFYFNKKLGYWFLAVASLMGLARVAAGVHWPTDVLAGAAIGVLSVYFVFRLLVKPKEENKDLASGSVS